jgi:protein TonB
MLIVSMLQLFARSVLMHKLRLVVAASAALIIGAAAPAFAQDSLTLRNVAVADKSHDLDAVSSPTRTQARIVRRAPAEWPSFEKLASIGGTVQIEVDLDASGQLTSAELLASSGHARFDRSALDAVRASTYQAARVDGRAVGGRYIVDVVFDPSI